MRSTLQELVSSGWFRYGFVPVLSALLVVLVKRESRSTPLKKEDFAIGIELMVVAIFVHLLGISDLARRIADGDPVVSSAVLPANSAASGSNTLRLLSQLHDSVFLLVLLIVGLWGTASFVRRSGWVSSTEMAPLKGIVIPLIMGVTYLYAALLGNGQ